MKMGRERIPTQGSIDKFCVPTKRGQYFLFAGVDFFHFRKQKCYMNFLRVLKFSFWTQMYYMFVRLLW